MLTDQRLVYKSKRGDQSAFKQIYETHFDKMLTVAISLLRDHGEAEDVVQEVFANFIDGLHEFELRSSLKGFLATCVVNRCRDHLRKQKRRSRVYTQADRTQIPQNSPIHSAAGAELLEAALCAFDQLPYEQREAISLKIHAQMTFRAMAKHLNLSLGTVQARYRYGLNHMRKQLNGK